MTDDAVAPPGASDAPPPFSSRSGFQAALLWGARHAVARQARQMWWVDSDFAEWPLSDPALLNLLTRWLRLPQRKLVLLAADYAHVPRCHPRFMRWRADWTHAIDAWSPPDDLAAGLPRLLLDDGPVSVQLLDAEQWRGRTALDGRSARLMRSDCDALLQRSEPAFPVHPLGL